MNGISKKICLKSVETKINHNIINEIIAMEKSCGIIAIYLLSLMFDIDFDLQYFKAFYDGNGLTDSFIQNYMQERGVNFFAMENQGMKKNIYYSNLDVLLQNGIATTFSGKFEDENGEIYPHGSILDVKRNLIFASDKNKYISSCISDHYFCFYSKSNTIYPYVTFQY